MMEENAQMSLLPDAAVAAQMTMTGEEEIDLSEYEIVRPEFFAHIKEPALTVNVDKIGVNTACVRLMPDVEYVQILINRKEKKLRSNPAMKLRSPDTAGVGQRTASGIPPSGQENFLF